MCNGWTLDNMRYFDIMGSFHFRTGVTIGFNLRLDQGFMSELSFTVKHRKKKKTVRKPGK